MGTSGAYESERRERCVKESLATVVIVVTPPPPTSREKLGVRRSSHFHFLLFRIRPEKRRIFERSTTVAQIRNRLKASSFQRFKTFFPSWYVVAPISSSFFSSFGSCFVSDLCCSSSSSSSSSSSVWFIHWRTGEVAISFASCDSSFTGSKALLVCEKELLCTVIKVSSLLPVSSLSCNDPFFRLRF